MCNSVYVDNNSLYQSPYGGQGATTNRDVVNHSAARVDASNRTHVNYNRRYINNTGVKTAFRFRYWLTNLSDRVHQI